MITGMFLKKLGMVACTFNPSTQEVETSRFLELSGQQVYTNHICWFPETLKLKRTVIEKDT